MKRTRIIALATLVALAAGSFGVAFTGGGGFAIDWFTIDGGGGESTGGTFALKGTIGQHDAGGPMTGGTFSLTGGFWAGAGGPSIATLTDLTMIDGVIIAGGLPEMDSSDDQYLETEAKVTGEAAETHRMRMQVGAATTVQNPSTIDITLEAHITDVEAIVTIFLRNWNNGNMEQVGQFTNGLGNDTTNTVNVPNASRFVRNDGRIELLLKKIVILPFTLNGFHSLEDLLEIRVR